MSNGTVLWNLGHASSGSTRAIARLVRRIVGAGALVLLMLLASTDRAEAQCVYCAFEDVKVVWDGTNEIVSIPCKDGGYARTCRHTRRIASRWHIEVDCEEQGTCRRGFAKLQIHPAAGSWAWSDTGSVKALQCGSVFSGAPVDSRPAVPARLTSNIFAADMEQR